MDSHDVSFRVAEALFTSLAKPGGARPAPTPAPFTIAITREAGARGKTVADEIGRRLGWPVYDRELIEKTAEHLRRPAFQIEKADERPVHWLEDCLTGLLTQHGVPTGTYLKHLIGVVRGLGLMLGLIGHCVFVGRGANFVLPPATTLRVRLVGALADRVKVMAALHGLDEKEAARKVAKTDSDRREFVRANLHVDPADPDHYDVILNTSRLSPPECARAVIEVLRMFEARAVGQQSPGAGPGAAGTSG
jgi:cytidylate kinase